MTIARLATFILPAGLIAALSACSSTAHTPVSDYPLVPPIDLTTTGRHANTALGLDRPADGQSPASWTSTWISGPASALATAEEAAAYQELEATSERSEFIRRFWLRRTPPPSHSPLSAFDTVRQRTYLAEQLFGGHGTPGWQTSFGRVLSILGAPVVIEEGKLRSGPRTSPAQRLRARRGDQVLWQYGWKAKPVDERARGAFTAPYFVAFIYGADGWSLSCGNEWVAQHPAGPDPAEDAVESPVSPNPSDRALGNPFATSGYKASSDYSDRAFPEHVYRFGSGCLELFERARGAWLTSTAPTSPLANWSRAP